MLIIVFGVPPTTGGGNTTKKVRFDFNVAQEAVYYKAVYDTISHKYQPLQKITSEDYNSGINAIK